MGCRTVVSQPNVEECYYRSEAFRHFMFYRNSTQLSNRVKHNISRLCLLISPKYIKQMYYRNCNAFLAYSHIYSFMQTYRRHQPTDHPGERAFCYFWENDYVLSWIRKGRGIWLSWCAVQTKQWAGPQNIWSLGWSYSTQGRKKKCNDLQQMECPC